MNQPPQILDTYGKPADAPAMAALPHIFELSSFPAWSRILNVNPQGNRVEEMDVRASDALDGDDGLTEGPTDAG